LLVILIILVSLEHKLDRDLFWSLLLRVSHSSIQSIGRQRDDYASHVCVIVLARIFFLAIN
jgi:hypothetical protein